MMKKLLLVVGMLLVADWVMGQGCNAGFTHTVNNCNLVSFAPVNTNQTYTYLWDFGDGNTSMEFTPTHLYMVYGTGLLILRLRLTVSGSDCTTSTISEVVTVTRVPDPSVVDASGNNFLRCSGGALTLQNISSTISTNTNYRIEWTPK
jgi:PKD repeat protein